MGLRAELAQLEGRDERVAVLARSAEPPTAFDGVWLDGTGRRARPTRARCTRICVRSMAPNADAILIEEVPDDGDWAAIRDRLARATSGEEDDRD